jgi:sucrose phosphorylase
MLTLQGIPGIYFHSLFGSRNWKEGVALTGHNRTINRQKLKLEALERQLSDPDSLRFQIFDGICRMLAVRKENPAFHPCGGQRILNLGCSIFALLRSSPNQAAYTLCLHNVTTRTQTIEVDLASLPIANASAFVDLLTHQTHFPDDQKLSLRLASYQISWLRAL